MDTAKYNIRNLVKAYIETCPQEFAAFKVQMNHLRGVLFDTDFGQSKGQGSDMRSLYEMPVTLHDILVKNLSDEELTWLKAGGADHKEGGRWFANTFPVFRTGSKG